MKLFSSAFIKASHVPSISLMTRPSNVSARTDGDFDFQALLNSREFQDAFNQFPNSNPFPILARYLQDNYNIIVDQGDFDSDSDESIELQNIDEPFEEAYADRFMQALVNGQRELPLRQVLPVTPPPSPMPNPALNRSFLSAQPPPLPPRRRSQLSSSMTTSTTNPYRLEVPRFTDLNAAEELKAPYGGFEVPMTPPDRNNDLPYTFEFQRRLRDQRGYDFPGR